MSERGGGLPGNPPRIPGIPSNAHFHELAEFRTLNVQRPRPSIQDQEMAWCQNLMPIGAYYLRALPDHGPEIFTVPGPPPGPAHAVRLQGVTPLLALDGATNGRIVSISTPPVTSGNCGPLTTTKANDFLVLIASAERLIVPGANPPIIQSVTSTSGLTWIRRFLLSQIMNSDHYPGSIYVVNEIWYAVAPNILNLETLTITYADLINLHDSAIFGCVAFSGVNISVGWDGITQSSGSLSPSPATPVQVEGITTTNSYDIIFSWFAGYRNPVLAYALPEVPPWGKISGGSAGESLIAGWIDAAVIVSGSNVGNWNQSIAFYDIVSVPKTNFTAPAFGDPAPITQSDWVGVADAVAGYMPGTPTVLTIASLANLPATADTLLIAGWVGGLGDGVTEILTDTGVGGISLSVNVSGVSAAWTFTARETGGATIVTGSPAIAVDLTSGWHSFAISARMSTQTFELLVDSTLNTPTMTWSSANPVGYPGGDGWQVGPVAILGELSSLWFAAGAALFDLSSEGNVDILFGETNCWQDWGTSGQLVTGISPPLFLYGTRVTYPNNFGTGGAFTVTGAPLANATGPIECA